MSMIRSSKFISISAILLIAFLAAWPELIGSGASKWIIVALAIVSIIKLLGKEKKEQ